MRKLIFTTIIILAILFPGIAVADIYECKNQFEDKVFTNAPKLRQWLCPDPNLSGYNASIGYSKQDKKVSDKCVLEILSACQALNLPPVAEKSPSISLSCVIEYSGNDSSNVGSSIRVQFNEGENAAVVNGHRATRVAFTETTLNFRWSVSDAQGILVIDRLSGRFRMGNEQFPTLATGQCDRISAPRF